MDPRVELEIPYISTKQLIAEVKKHPSLWKKNEPSYKVKEERSRAWELVGEALIGAPYAENKEVFEKLLNKRWRFVRDAYVKCKRTFSSNTNANKKSIKYIYFDDLRFLDLGEDKEPNQNVSDNITVESEDSEDDVKPTPDDLKTFQDNLKREKRPASPPREAPAPKTRPSHDYNLALASDDLAFFTSLAPMLNLLSPFEKLELRSKFLKSVMDFETASTLKRESRMMLLLRQMDSEQGHFSGDHDYYGEPL